MKDQSKHELAEDRTDWAGERTVLAKERTFSAWVRTAVTLAAAALGISRLLRSLEPDWLVKSVGIIFLLLALMCLLMGFLSYRKTGQALQRANLDGLPVWVIGLFSLVMALAACVSLVLVLRD